ncbi:MAG: HD domain-containing protein [Thermoanaerobaculales bacterium]|jgi:putative nucleotidyltransferase with HDIG domain|nr:HD domain-containing protein [Thermoanaerobaculales bacterium]
MGFLERLRSSLTYPIAATLVLVTVVPMVAVGLALISSSRTHLTTVENRFLGRQAVSLAGELSLFVDTHRTQLQSAARALAAAELIDADGFGELLQGMANEPGRAFVSLQIVPTEGIGAFAALPNLNPATVRLIDAAVQEAHLRTVRGEAVQEVLLELPTGEAPKAIFAFPLRSRDGEIWGSLSGALDLGPLQDRLGANTYAGLMVSVVDDRGRVVISSRPEMRRIDASASPLVRDFLSNPQRLTLTYEHPLGDQGEVLASMAPAGVLGWGVLIERPAAEAYAPVRTNQLRTLGLIALAALVALGIGFALSRRLITPLQSLAATTSQLADGNLTVRATVRGADEIALLGSNFNNMAGNIEALVRRLRQALRQNQELFLETIRTLAAAIDAKDPYTRGHSERVASYAMAISRHLGLSQEEVFRVHIAAILHDVGKLGIRDGILNKPGGLSDEEFEVMRQHPAIGAQIMSPIRMLKDIIPGIRNHHETWDGTGYPDRLKGEQIPMVARIIGVSDTFDAMTTTRPYQQAMTLDYVLTKMRSMVGSRFDPKVIDAFTAAVSAGDISPPTQGSQELSPEVS